MMSMLRLTRRFAFSIPALCLVVLLPSLVGGCGTEEPEVTGDPVISSDGESVVTIKQSGDKLYVEQNGRRLPGRYDFVPQVISTERGAVFAAKQGDKWVVMRGDERIGDEYDFVGGVTASPEGEVAFITQVGDRRQIMRDGEPVGEAYERVGPPVYSPDGGSLVYTAEEGGASFVVRDGVRQPGEYEWVETPSFGPDGESVFYIAQVGDGRQVLIKDGTEITPPQEGRIAGWATTADDQSIALLIERDGEMTLITNGRQIGGAFERGKFEYITPLLLGPDGRRVFFAASVSATQWHMYRDGQQTGESFQADRVTDLRASPDGRSVACLARRDGLWYVIKDGQVVSDGFHKISNLRTGPEGRTLIFSGLKGSRITEEEIEW